jgi:hypothetical protein
MKKFFFLLLLLIVLGVAGYFYAILFAKNFRASRAEAKGMDYVSKVYTEYQVVGKDCQGEDTDSNDYVTCGFRVKNASGTERTVRLECPTIIKGYLGSNCRENLSIPEALQ